MGALKNTRTLIVAALFAALTCASTMVIRIPTPTMGYVHPGDAFVLLSGFLLGPVVGGLAAGLGSCFADIFGGYFTYAPATFLIKAMCAFLAAHIAARIPRRMENAKGSQFAGVVPAGVVGELFMVIGYFVYEIFLLAVMAGGLNATTLGAGVAGAAGGVLFNVVQGVVGIILATVLFPILNPLCQKVISE